MDDDLCQEIRHLAGEGPQPCGLELPCPRHRADPLPRQATGKRRADAEWSSRMLGDTRDV